MALEVGRSDLSESILGILIPSTGGAWFSLSVAREISGRIAKRCIGRDEGRPCGFGRGVICELLGKLGNSLPPARVPYAEKCLDEPELLASPPVRCNIVVHGHVVLRDSLIARR